MTKFDLVSDLHVDINGYDDSYYDWSPQSDTILIVGDCANDAELSIKVLAEAKNHYEHVLFTDGNHEHYSPRKRSVNANIEILNSLDGIHYLNMGMVIIGGTIFVGANGWYDFNCFDGALPEHQRAHWKSDMNDSKVIRFNDMPDVMASQHYEYIANIVEKAQDDPTIDDIVIMTHTIPMRELAVPRHHQWAYLNGSYVNSHMRKVISKSDKISTWVYGHTHYHNDKTIDGVRFINNARGYDVAKENSFTGSILVYTQDNRSYDEIFG